MKNSKLFLRNLRGRAKKTKNPFGYSFSSIRLSNWQLSLLQYKLPLEINVQQTYTYFSKITKGRLT